METQRKPLNFAAALRAKLGEKIVDVHSEEPADVPTPKTEPSALSESAPSTSSILQPSASPEAQPSTIDENERPRQNVDVKPATHTPTRAVKPSTRRRSGRRKNDSADVHKPATADRHSKDLARYDQRIDPVVKEHIQHFCVNMKMTQAEFAETSAVHFMACVAVHKEGSADVLPSHDDRKMMMGYKTLSPIISLYLQYCPDNHWKPRDDRVGQEFNGADIRLVEIGILHTLLRTNEKRIHSFAYFRDEIADALDVPLANETIELMLKRRRMQYAERGRA